MNLTAGFCGQCGLPAPIGGRFCQQCGAPLGTGTVGRPVALADALEDQLAQATIGEYQVLGELGRGGMAAVFLAEDLSLGRRVAIKVMIPGLDVTGAMAERFLLEARTAAQLSHPNIIPIYAVRTTGELRYFVMKFVAGCALDRLVAERGPLPVPVVQAVLAHVGDALTHAHGRGVIHRDIKPANIMLDEDGTPIVADFGIAKVAQGGRLTQTGTAVGTPTYMSPEQCSGRPITGASDQYALGCVAFELLTGRPPFVHEEVVPVLLSHVQEAPPPILTLRPDCPRPLAAAVERMLAKGPEERWQSLHDAIEAGSDGQTTHLPAVRQALRELAASGEVPVFSARSVPVSPFPASRVVAAPGGRPSVEAAVAISSVGIEPNGVALSAGTGAQLRATPRDASGLPVAVPVQWESSNPLVAIVSPAGVVTALSEGAVEVSARAGTVTGSVQVRVAPVPVARVRLSSSHDRLQIGARQTLQAVALDQAGSVLPGRVIRWESLDPVVATVSATGAVTALREGTARIQVSCEGQQSQAAVEVRAAEGQLVVLPGEGALSVGQVVRLGAYWKNSAGELSAAAAVWESFAPEILRITSEGELTALRPGNGTIRARVGGAERLANYVCTRVDVAEIRIQPRLSALGAGETARLAAFAVDRLGAGLTGRVVTWSSSNPEVVVVEPDGTVRGVHPGVARINASMGAGLAWLEVRITPAQVTSLRLEPASLSLRVGEPTLLRAIVLGGRGAVLSGIPVEWQSSDPAVASVDPQGVVTGHRFGLVRVAATIGGRRATVPVEIRPPSATSGPRARLG